MNKLFSILLVLCTITLVRSQSSIITAENSTVLSTLVGLNYLCSFTFNLTYYAAGVITPPDYNNITVSVGTESASPSTDGAEAETTGYWNYNVTVNNANIGANLPVIVSFNNNTIVLTTPITVTCQPPVITYAVSVEPESTQEYEGGSCTFTAEIAATVVEQNPVDGAQFTISSPVNGVEALIGNYSVNATNTDVYTYAITITTPVGNISASIQLAGVNIANFTDFTCNAGTPEFADAKIDQASKTAQNNKCAFTLTVTYELNGAAAGPAVAEFELVDLPTNVTAGDFASSTAGVYTVVLTTPLGKFNTNNTIILNVNDTAVAGYGVTGEDLPSFSCNVQTEPPKTSTTTGKGSEDSSSASSLVIGLTAFFSALIVLLL